MAKGTQTRERILEIAEKSVLAKGFGGTSIDEIVHQAELTKSGFLYHFRDKNALAKALLDRYVETDDRIFDDLLSRADALTDDPLQKMLVFLALLAELFDDLPNGHPGCIVAAVCYGERLFQRDVREANERALRSWRARFTAAFRDVVTSYPPNDDVEIEDLADMLTVVADGAIILSKAVREPRVLGAQIRLLRSYVKLLFTPPRPLSG